MNLPLGVFNKQNAPLTFAGHPSKPSQRATDHLIFRLDVHFMLVINGTATTQCRGSSVEQCLGMLASEHMS